MRREYGRVRIRRWWSDSAGGTGRFCGVSVTLGPLTVAVLRHADVRRLRGWCVELHWRKRMVLVMPDWRRV